MLGIIVSALHGAELQVLRLLVGAQQLHVQDRSDCFITAIQGTLQLKNVLKFRNSSMYLT